MKLSRIRPGTLALAFGSGLLVLVGVATDNGGFQLAGGILAVVVAVMALRQAKPAGETDQGGNRSRS